MHLRSAKGILSAQNGMNVYRGCTHGCIYCDSRSRCYHIDHEFTDVEVKENAPALLEDALRRKRKKCMIGTGAMCDPYMPLEMELGLTRRCLEIVERYGFGLAIQTKSTNLLRDLKLLQSINEKAKCVAQVTLTTADEKLCRLVEPNVAATQERFRMLCALREAGIPTVVWLSPFLPWLNDTVENLSALLEMCREARVWGVLCFGIGLTLREGNREYFYQQLDRLFPGLKERYARAYGLSYEVASPRNEELMRLLTDKCGQYGIVCDNERVFHYLRTLDETPEPEQLSLF